MKFTPKPGKFNAGNAAGDIQLIQRVGGKLTHAIHEAGMQGSSFEQSIFMTADSGLQQLFSYFFVKNVRTLNTEDGSTDEFNVDVKSHMLFVKLFGPDGRPKDEKCAEELKEIYGLLGFEFSSAS